MKKKMENINPIFYNPEASITCNRMEELDFYGTHKLTEEEKKEISELGKNFKDVDKKKVLNFVLYLDDDFFSNAILKKLYIESFKDFRSCIRLYDNILNKIFYGNYKQIHIFYFNKIFKEFVNLVFCSMNIMSKTERLKFVKEVYNFDFMQTRGGGVYGDLRSFKEMREELEKEENPNIYFLKKTKFNRKKILI